MDSHAKFLVFSLISVQCIFTNIETLEQNSYTENRLRRDNTKSSNSPDSCQITSCVDGYSSELDCCSTYGNRSVTCWANSVFIQNILSCLKATTEDLTINVNNNDQGPLHVNWPLPINLTGISRLHQLKQFHLKPSSGKTIFLQPRVLIYSERVTRLPLMRELHLNIPLEYDTEIMQLTSCMSHLEVLDLSDTVTLSFNKLQKGLSNLNSATIKSLSISNFQTTGSLGFRDDVSMADLFGNNKILHKLENLDLSYNYLGVLKPSVVHILPNLKVLNVSHNNLILTTNAGFFIELLLSPSLYHVNIGNQGNQLQKFSENVYNFQHTKRRALTTFTFFDDTVYCVNSVSSNISLAFFDNTFVCRVIDCIFTYLTKEFSLNVPCSLFGRLSEMFDTSCAFFFVLPLFNNIQYMNADNLNWLMPEGVTCSGNVCFKHANLKHLSFRNNKIWFQTQYLGKTLDEGTSVRGMEGVEYLDVADNQASFVLPFNLSNIFPTMQRTNFSNNQIRFRNKGLCKMWPNIREFSASQNSLTDVPVVAFTNCAQLEEISLQGNNLRFRTTYLDLEGTVKLKHLDLTRNNITLLSKAFRGNLDKVAHYQLQKEGKVDVKLSLSNNPLQCSCTEDVIEFVEWYLSTRVHINNDNQIICYIRDQVEVLTNESVSSIKWRCSNIAVIVESVAVTVSLAMVVLVPLGLYKIRWKLKYKWYKLNQNLKQALNTRDTTPKKWKYDAFVSYCADDRFWVHGVLMKTLEETYGFQLCIHYRDFRLGVHIAEEIIANIQKSKELIIVISKYSVNRRWCNYEVEVALGEAVKRNIKLLVIRLGGFDVSDDNTVVKWVMQNQVYLQWTNNPNSQSLFWSKLICHLYGKSEGNCCWPKRRGYREVEGLADMLEDEETTPLL